MNPSTTNNTFIREKLNKIFEDFKFMAKYAKENECSPSSELTADTSSRSWEDVHRNRYNILFKKYSSVILNDDAINRNKENKRNLIVLSDSNDYNSPFKDSNNCFFNYSTRSNMSSTINSNQSSQDSSHNDSINEKRNVRNQYGRVQSATFTTQPGGTRHQLSQNSFNVPSLPSKQDPIYPYNNPVTTNSMFNQPHQIPFNDPSLFSNDFICHYNNHSNNHVMSNLMLHQPNHFPVPFNVPYNNPVTPNSMSHQPKQFPHQPQQFPLNAPSLSSKDSTYPYNNPVTPNSMMHQPQQIPFNSPSNDNHFMLSNNNHIIQYDNHQQHQNGQYENSCIDNKLDDLDDFLNDYVETGSLGSWTEEGNEEEVVDRAEGNEEEVEVKKDVKKTIIDPANDPAKPLIVYKVVNYYDINRKYKLTPKRLRLYGHFILNDSTNDFRTWTGACLNDEFNEIIRPLLTNHDHYVHSLSTPKSLLFHCEHNKCFNCMHMVKYKYEYHNTEEEANNRIPILKNFNFKNHKNFTSGNHSFVLITLYQIGEHVSFREVVKELDARL